EQIPVVDVARVAPVAPAPTEPRLTREEAGPAPKDVFGWAILSCALFLPIGLFAVVKAASVRPQWASGEYSLARRSAATAQTAAIAACVAGVVVIAAVLGWLVISTR
ncbi:CD225/dispanin family protein, partial [Gordonia sp. UBA5067]